MNEIEIPDGLKEIARGRDVLLIEDVSLATNTAQQTIRKSLCLKGNFEGLIPKKIAGRWNFKTIDIARLING